MKRIIQFIICICFPAFANSQYTLNVSIKDADTKEPVSAVTVTVISTGKRYISDKKGTATITGIPAGKQLIVFSHSGYAERTDSISFPATEIMEILLQKEEEVLEAVIIQSTRTSRTIQNTPTRVETIDAEEIDEKGNMRPANVSMLLHESTGLQVQQTSATSGNASIRVQGLDGRYTQLLKDGYPNFGNFAGGLSLLEIPPLDLKQVEVIKGPASTLYGAGAIAGVINFISKQPKKEGEYNFILNQSNIGQTNIGAYVSKRNIVFGYSLLALFNHQRAYDVDKDDFSELPKTTGFTIHPRLFFYPSPSISIMLGNSFTKGKNFGGDIHVINDKPAIGHSYFEKNNTTRNTSTFEFVKKFNSSNLTIKQSLSLFNRDINSPGYSFGGKNTNSFTDISYVKQLLKHAVVGGINLVYDKFSQSAVSTAFDQRSFTAGMYIQDTWDITERIKLESGIRFDQASYSNINFSRKKNFFLPRISALFRITDNISSRISGGMGYKIPTIFTEQTETLLYQNLLALDNVVPEKSTGYTADINYRTRFSPDLNFSFNQLFFYTTIRMPLVLTTNGFGQLSFSNATKPTTSMGFETNAKFIYHNLLKLFIGYTYTDARATYLTGEPSLTLLPRHKLNLALLCEKENNFKIGLEGYLTGNQYLSDRTKTASYWELGFMAEKTIKKKFSLYINFENFTDERQSKYRRVVSGPNNAPVFDEIWNHTEGFVINGGIKIRL